ncbi:MAG: hypothetical protein NTW80_12510, partial [Deltaproteobacteria bacterium]|nr:hypothetical protein [Deltaproteobacteria bacterium]
SSNYTLNLPPNSKDLFSKNITLARIEYPGVASRSVQTATRSNGHQYSRKSQASQPAEAPVAKSNPKHVVHTKAGTTNAKATTTNKPAAAYAKKGKAEAPTPAVQASMFGAVGAASKAHTSGHAKGKTQTVAKSGSKKPVAAKMAKSGEPAAKGAAKSKAAKKSNTSSGKAKEKVSKAKSAAIFAAK